MLSRTIRAGYESGHVSSFLAQAMNLVGVGVPALPEVQVFQELFGALLGFRASQTVNWTNHHQVFPDGQRLKQCELFREDADLLFDFGW